jgi:ABC-type amino acid transport substrate-binding protein
VARRTPGKVSIVALALLCAAGAAEAQCPARTPGVDVAVGIRAAAPFVDFDHRGAPQGLAIDIWTLVERELRREGLIGTSEFILCPSIRDQMAALSSGALDVVISPLTITAERMRVIAFSQQYLASGLTVMQRDSGAIDFSHAAGIITDTVTQPGVARALLGFLALNLVVALLIRWALRAEGEDPEAEKGRLGAAVDYLIEAVARTLGLKGVGDGFRSAAGKTLEIFMAVVGTALSATVIGVLTSAFVGAIGSRTALPAEGVVALRVATLANSTSQDFLVQTDRRVNGPRTGHFCVDRVTATPADRCLLAQTWDEAASLLASGEVEAVLGDWVALSYLARLDRHAGQLSVQGQTYVGEAYGWGVTPLRPDLRDAIDRILIDEMRQPGWRRRIENALGTGAISPE